MKILITGGTGFQGSHLARYLLKDGHCISILNTQSDRAIENIKDIINKVQVYWGDIKNNMLIDKAFADQDVIFHLAGNVNVDQSLQDPLLYFNNNILGTYNILEAVKHYKNRLIFVSTCEVYGDGHGEDVKTLAESTELRPSSPYAASKTAADRMCYTYFRSYGVDVTIVRPFNIYGEKQKAGKFGALIPIFVSRAMEGKNLTIFGDGRSERDYMHVDDIIQGYNIILNNPTLTGQVINFASGENITIKEIAEYIAKKFDVSIDYGPARIGEVTRLPADILFARRLGYKPQVDLWQGIDRYIEWVKS